MERYDGESLKKIGNAWDAVGGEERRPGLDGFSLVSARPKDDSVADCLYSQ